MGCGPDADSLKWLVNDSQASSSFFSHPVVFLLVTLGSLQQAVSNVAPAILASSLTELCTFKYNTQFIQWLEKITRVRLLEVSYSTLYLFADHCCYIYFGSRGQKNNFLIIMG